MQVLIIDINSLKCTDLTTENGIMHPKQQFSQFKVN